MKPKAQMVIAVGLQAPSGPINTDPRLCRASSAQAWQEYLPCHTEEFPGLSITGSRSGIRATKRDFRSGVPATLPTAETCPYTSPRSPPGALHAPCSGFRQTPGSLSIRAASTPIRLPSPLPPSTTPTLGLMSKGRAAELTQG